jgi:hypothetical protein
MKSISSFLFVIAFNVGGTSIYAQSNIPQKPSDFRFETDVCDSTRCHQSQCVSVSVHALNDNRFIGQFYSCLPLEQTTQKEWLQTGDYDFDGYTDFRMRIKKITSITERVQGGPEFFYDYDYYMFDAKSQKFYRHFVSNLRHLTFDIKKKRVSGTLYDPINYAGTNMQPLPTKVNYIFVGESLKYATITPADYPSLQKQVGNYNSRFVVFENNGFRDVRMEDAPSFKVVEKQVGNFRFEKHWDLYPRAVNLETKPNPTYRSMYYIYQVSNDTLLGKINGLYESLFGGFSDSIVVEDCNFDGFPDLIIQNEQSFDNTYIYFYNQNKNSFEVSPLLGSLEKIKIDFNNKTIRGTNIRLHASEINRWGQMVDPKKRTWKEYTFSGTNLRYVKVETYTFEPKKGRKMKVEYFIHTNNVLKQIRKREYKKSTDIL